MRCYLAGPFFNKACVNILLSMCQCLEELDFCQVWAPMRDGIKCPKDATWQQRREVFDLDCGKIQTCDCIVALLDYPLPEYQQLLMRERTPEGEVKLLDVNFPDSGTVFEMGFAAGLNSVIPNDVIIIGFTQARVGFNLMISEACHSIATSLNELRRIALLARDKDLEGLDLLKIAAQKRLTEY